MDHKAVGNRVIHYTRLPSCPIVHGVYPLEQHAGKKCIISGM